MSYIDVLQNSVFSIETARGDIFYPIWKGANKEIEYNTSIFDFINVTGTLVDRKKPRSPQFEFVFYFQGDDYLFEAESFEIACQDPRPITVQHPYYGTIKGQPLSIKRNDESIGIVEFTMPFWESIDINYPFSNFSIKDNTREKNAKVQSIASISFITNNPIKTEDIEAVKDKVSVSASEIKKIESNSTYADFQNALNKSLASIDNILEQPLEAIQNIQAFLDLPAQYLNAVEARLSVYEGIYNRLEDTIEDIVSLKYFESVGASVVSLISVVLVTPLPDDYVLVSTVFNKTARLLDIFNRYQLKLEQYEVSVYDVENSFTPDPLLRSELKSLVLQTYAGLYNLSFGLKKEKKFFFQKNTNPILVVHKHIGLNETDSYLEDFIFKNNIKLKELFNVKKGRELKILI